ncbi:ribonuclease H-like domain-containing protein [Tanacetum coccineum]
MNVSPIPTTRIDKDHPKDQIIGDLNSAIQTRRMTKIYDEHAMDRKAIGYFLGHIVSFMGFIVYQMDVKCAFLYGTIEDEVYVCQPPGFEDPQFPDKVPIHLVEMRMVYKGVGQRHMERACHYCLCLEAEHGRSGQIAKETSFRSDLNLEDAGWYDCVQLILSFEELSRMGASTEPMIEKETNEESVPEHSYDPSQSGEDRIKLHELMNLCLQENLLVSKIYRVGSTRRVESSNDEGLGTQEDASKRGRSIEDIDKDAEVSLVDETQGRMRKDIEQEEFEDDDEALLEDEKNMEIVQDKEEIAIDAIPLATKPPMIIEYKIVKEGHKGFYHLIRVDGSSKWKIEDSEDEHQCLGRMLGNLRLLRRFLELILLSYTLLLLVDTNENYAKMFSTSSIQEVILNGNKVLKRTVREVEQEYEPISAEEKQDRRNEMKARGTLLMALPNKDQLKFHSYKDAKLLMEAIEKRLQKPISQLEIQGEVIAQDDMNLKLLRSLPSEWKTHALIWRNKAEIKTISLDDFTNSNSNSNTNEAYNTTYGVSAAHTQSNPTSRDNLSDVEMAMLTIRARRFIKRTGSKFDVNGQRVRFDSSKVECYNCHKNGHFTRECRAPRNQENRERENNRRTVAYTSSGSSSSSDSKVDSCSKSCVKAYATLKEQYDSLSLDYKKSQFNLVSYKVGFESVEARLTHYKKNEVVFEESINVLNLEVKLRDNTLVENKKKLEKAEKERDELKLTLEKFQNSSKSLNNLLESLENNKSKSDKGYHVVPLPYKGNFIPSKHDLMFMDKIVESENMDVITIVTPSNVKKVESNHESADVKNNGDAVEPKTVKKNSFRPLVIKDWNFDDDSEVEFIPNVEDKTVRPSIEKIKFVKSARETVKNVETPKQNKYYPRGNQRNWNNLMSQRLGSDFKMINKACFICGSFEHLHYVCDKKVVRLVWNNSSRVNHKNFANKMTHPYPNRRFVPQAVLTRFGKINTVGLSVNIVVRPVNTDGSKTTMNHPRPISNAYKKGYSQVTRPSNKYSANKKSIFNKKVNTVRVKDTTARNRAAGNPQQKEYKEKGFIDSGCSRNMTGNKCYLNEYEYYDGGFVSFGDGKGRISRKGKIKTGTLDFDNQLDESQVLLRVPRKDNIYSVELKSIVPTKGLTCLFAKATIDESNLWHKRLGHINFKNINKLVKGNLNGVAERRNRTLIKAARTMLVNFKLPTTFWAEAVNTVCYVLNKVLVIKPHTKTPYELIRGRTLLIDFMKPFGYPVTILNTKDHIDKFDGKADEGFFVVKWTRLALDVDSLTISMNYVPVVAGNQTNGIARTRDNIISGQVEKKTESKQEYILIPLCTTDPLISQGPKDSKEDVGIKPIKVNESGASDKGEEGEQDTRSEFERLLQQEKQTNSTNSFNTVGTPVSAAGPSFTNDDLSSLVNATKASNAFEDHIFE